MLRRSLVQAVLSGGIFAVVIPPAAAEPKIFQTDAEYQSRPKDGLTCSACSLFRPPHACAVVVGDISPKGWCRFFDLPD